MKPASFLILLPSLLLALTACDRDHASNQGPPSKKESAGEVAAGSTNYLDYKNGFRDVTFGGRMEIVKDLELMKQEQVNGHTLSAYKRTTDTLSLNEVPLDQITYIFLNNELASVTIGWKIPFTNSVDVEIANITAATGIKNHKFTMGIPTGLENFTETLYGKPSQLERKDSPSEPGKEVRMKTTTAEWVGQRVRLDFYESQLTGTYPDSPSQTLGSIQIADIQRWEKVKRLARLIEANTAAGKKDGL